MKKVGNISNHVLKSITAVMYEVCIRVGPDIDFCWISGNWYPKSISGPTLVCMSSKFINSCKYTILDMIRETPERPVMQIYKEVYNSTCIEFENLRNEDIL